jgi:hypothetical protein
MPFASLLRIAPGRSAALTTCVIGDPLLTAPITYIGQHYRVVAWPHHQHCELPVVNSRAGRAIIHRWPEATGQHRGATRSAA